MRRSCTVEDAASVAAEVRALVPAAASVAAEVREIVDSVRDGGDAAGLEWERRVGGGGRRFAGTEPAGGAGGPFRVPPDRLAATLDALDPAVRAGLEMAVANVS